MAERDVPMNEHDMADVTVPLDSVRPDADAISDEYETAAVTVPLDSVRPDADADAISDEYETAAVTVPLAPAPMWQPGPRLAARVEPRQPRQQTEQRRDPRLIGAAILIVAIAVAIALWLTALWLQANDTPDPEPTGETESTISSVFVMTAAEHQRHGVVVYA